jgi:hypothetical protein
VDYLKGYIIYVEDPINLNFFGYYHSDAYTLTPDSWNFLGVSESKTFIEVYPEYEGEEYVIYAWEREDFVELVENQELIPGNAYLVGTGSVANSPPPKNLKMIDDLMNLREDFYIGSLLINDEFERGMLLEKLKK